MMPGERLSCGRPVEEVLAQVADDRTAELDAHQRQCLHCRAALAEYDRLWAPVRELAAEKVVAPTSMVEIALGRIRGAVEHIDHGVLESAQGSTRISARVVVVTARETANSVPGVRVALSRHLIDPATNGPGAGVAPDLVGPNGVAAGVAGRSTAIEITLAADHGIDLQRLGERVRAEVITRVRDLTDLEPVHVTVVIDDIFDQRVE
jgi:uncharacterized alkaline shock family protein YloU